VALENQSTASRTDGLQTGRRFLHNLGKVLGAVLLLALGLRFLNVFGLNAFLNNYDAAAMRNQVFAFLLFVACQIGGGGLLRSLFRKPVPEIDRNEGMRDRFFSVLRWSLLFCGVSAITVFLFVIYVRGTHTR
jgi:hypothetical protein